MKLIGILGGTFDPIHNAHLHLAHQARQQLKLDQVRFIPVNIPPHREKTVVTALHRKRMIALATAATSYFILDCRELICDAVSYSINTLKSLRQEFMQDSLCLILGQDAFNQLDTWKDWRELLGYAHIIVANRPIQNSNTPVSTELQSWMKTHLSSEKAALKEQLFGKLFFMTIPELNVSSSIIRQRIQDKKTIKHLLPEKGLHYIEKNNLYLTNTI